MSVIFSPAEILLPEKRFGQEASKFSVIACDQFTSEKGFWSEYENLIGDAPSSLRLVLPEAFLDESEKRIPTINSSMDDYLVNHLESFSSSMIYVRRKQPDGRIRCGIVGKIDLEYYDFSDNSSSLIRPTEKTVLERIPPRVKIRENASIELPHVMLLIDDADKTVIEPFENKYSSMTKAYDFELMMGAGHIEGYFIDECDIRRINALFARYSSASYAEQKYSKKGAAPLLFAVGDGNHSLATAKAIYLSAKESFGEQAKKMPCRYALAEVVNLHSDALDFEPIYRTVECPDNDTLIELKDFLKRRFLSEKGDEAAYDIVLVNDGTEEIVHVAHPVKSLPVALVQDALDEFISTHGDCVVDYIHGEDSLRALSENNVLGILFEGMSKDDLFVGVMQDGILPRKTFSMGHALDKRHYLEARKIK